MLSTHQVQIQDPDLWDLLPDFLTNRHQDILTLHTAIQTNDVPTIQRLGHNMKGAGAAYALPEITTIGAALESAAKASDLPSALSLTDQLEDYLSRLEVIPAFAPGLDLDLDPIATAA